MSLLSIIRVVPVCFLVFVMSLGLLASEDCANLIDDDGDGLIDCQDPDCLRPSFSNHSYPVSRSEDAVSVDLDNDGDVDIATAGTLDGSSVYLNDGFGGLNRSSVLYINTLRVAAGDFNADSLLDLAFVNSGSSVQVHMNLGLGQFAPAIQQTFGGSVYDIDSGDLNGDGFDDLVLSVYGSSNEVWFCDGAGGFSKSQQVLGSASSTSIELADFDSDGDLDFLVGAYVNGGDGGLSLFLNDGGGVFGQASLPIASRTEDLSVDDIDGDGDLDFYATYPGYLPKVGFNNGFAQFDIFIGGIVGQPTDRCELIDLNQDGLMEVVEIRRLDNLRYRSIASTASSQTVFPDGLSNAFACTAAVKSDFNSDGAEDVFILGANENVLLLGKADQDYSFRIGTTDNYAVQGSRGRLLSGDFDADGDIDFVAKGPEGSAVRMFLNNLLDGSGGFESLDLNGSSFIAYDIDSGDLNCDGVEDLLFSRGVNAYLIALLGPDFTTSININTPANVFETAIADLNGDSCADIVSCGFSSVLVGFGNGTGSVSLQSLSGVSGGNFASVAVGDLDNDGDVDIVVARDSAASAQPPGGVVWFLNDGFGGFNIHSQTLISSTRSVAVLDVDNDGDLDFYLGSNGPSGDTVALNDGFANFNLVGSSWGFGRTSCIKFFDFNYDGLEDAVTASEDLSEPSRVNLNIGNGVFEESAELGSGGISSLLVEDFDSDGLADVLLGSTTSDALVKLCRNTSPCTDVDSDGIPDSCDFDIIQGADCDLNGQDDSCQSDQDNDGIIDPCDDDIDGDSVLDACDLDYSSGEDCDLDGQLDSCQIASEPSLDCDLSGILDFCELESGASSDCNSNQIPDSCDISIGSSTDCDSDSIPDDCESDQDQDGNIDDCDPDIDGDGVPNECDATTSALEDCDISGIADSCEIDQGLLSDCDLNGVPDNCEYASAEDCNSNGLLDSCDILVGISQDCSGNGIPDECEIQSGSVADCNSNGVPDQCDYLTDPDCNSNGILDSCDIGLGIDTDCDLNGIPDLCDLLAGADCNSNGVLDACDISGGFSEDCDGNQVPDSCDIAGGAVDDDSNGIPDSCEPQAFRRGDLNTDGIMDVSDAVFGLEFLFGTQTVTCEDAADANDDGSLNIGDAVFILSALFNSGDLPPDPGSQSCGLDPTVDSLGCEVYGGCL